MASDPIDIFLSRLTKVTRVGSGKYKACCPAHEDKNPSMAIKVGPNGQVVFHCFAGCTPLDVVGAIGLQFSDLYVDDNHTPKQPDLTNEYMILKITQKMLEAGQEIHPLDKQRAELALRRVKGE